MQFRGERRGGGDVNVQDPTPPHTCGQLVPPPIREKMIVLIF